MNKRIAILGAGFSGLAASAMLAKRGFEVDVFEKNLQPGGRARNFVANGFTFDMGPTWYWLPDVFEKFFSNFGHNINEFYELKRLDPSYRMYFGKDDYIDMPANLEEVYQLFERLEYGSASKLRIFLREAEFKYNLGIKEIIYKPSLSAREYLDWRIMTGALRLDVFKSMTTYIKGMFKNPKIIKILEFPVIFLGASPSETPALYSMMNHADITLGTWYPVGGMYKVIEALVKLNFSLGVNIHVESEIKSLEINNNKILSINTFDRTYATDALVASGDYHYVEQHILPQKFRNYNKKYWESRKMAPSALLFYLGLNKKIKNLQHHNLFFDKDFEKHANEIYRDPKWPTEPALYVSVSSKTDIGVAPEGCENLIVLIPVASGLTDTENMRSYYFNYIIERLEFHAGENIRDHIIYKRSYAHNDFQNDYYAFKGNAYGLANTLMQTAFLKPKMMSKKLSNLFYCGQLTVPGPGVPPSLISGEIVSGLVTNYFKKEKL